MLPNEMYTVCREEFEKLLVDPRAQLSVLNIRIEFLKVEIGLLLNELKAMESRQHELVKEVLNSNEND